MSMSITDRYTQSLTRLHNSVTELNVATALLQHKSANAHLAARTPVIALIQLQDLDANRKKS